MSADAQPDRDAPRSGSTSAAISTAIMRIQRDYLGRGPDKARTSIRDDAVLVVLQETLTKAERSLVDAGDEKEVLHIRHQFQHAMGADMIDAVQRITGRTVVTFMSDNHIDPDYAAEIFVLEPLSEPPRATAPAELKH